MARVVQISSNFSAHVYDSTERSTACWFATDPRGDLQTADAARALELTADSVFSVFEATVRAGTRELALIDAQDAIAAPSRRFPASRL